MIRGGFGGAKTLSGLRFEKRVDLADLFAKAPGYSITESTVFFKNKPVAQIFKKDQLYSRFLTKKGVEPRKILSKKLLPDNALFVIKKNKLFIVEVKFQEVSGSVDEKLQTCDFKLKQYHKLLAPLGYDVEYVYVLNEWFKKPEYHDVLEYVTSVGCKYFFYEIPLSFFGLPLP